MSADAPPRPGCLSDAEIASLQGAEPGRVPEALARHLASCERCQARALFGAGTRPGFRRPTPEPPSLGRLTAQTSAISSGCWISGSPSPEGRKSQSLSAW